MEILGDTKKGTAFAAAPISMHMSWVRIAQAHNPFGFMVNPRQVQESGFPSSAPIPVQETIS